MASNWTINVYELGLLNWSFDLCARLLDFGPAVVYLTNDVTFGLAAVVSIDDASSRWLKVPNGVATGGLPFPYGRDVEPP